MAYDILSTINVNATPTVNVHMPKDRITQQHQGYGFVEFMGEDDADYSIKIMNMIKMFGKPIRVNKVGLFKFLNLTLNRIIQIIAIRSYGLNKQPVRAEENNLLDSDS